MNFNHFFLGDKYYLYKKYDTALSIFEKSDFLDYQFLYSRQVPNDFQPVFEFLESEGLVKITKGGIYITEKGKIKIRNGGFVRQFRNDTITRISVIVGIVAGIAAVVGFIIQFLD